MQDVRAHVESVVSAKMVEVEGRLSKTLSGCPQPPQTHRQVVAAHVRLLVHTASTSIGSTKHDKTLFRVVLVESHTRIAPQLHHRNQPLRRHAPSMRLEGCERVRVVEDIAFSLHSKAVENPNMSPSFVVTIVAMFSLPFTVWNKRSIVNLSSVLSQTTLALALPVHCFGVLESSRVKD